MPHPPEPLQFRLADRLALRPREAAAALGLSERTFRSLLPRLPHVRLGGAVLVPLDALRKWLELQLDAEESSARKDVEEIEAAFAASSSRAGYDADCSPRGRRRGKLQDSEAGR